MQLLASADLTGYPRVPKTLLVGPIKRTKARVALLLFVLCVGGLWIAGPLPLATGVYVQSVTAERAVVCKVDRSPRRLRVRVWPEGSDSDQTIVASEEEPQTLHALTVAGLQPNTRYQYALDELDDVGGEGTLSIDRGSFRTPPISDTVPVRFATVGDSGDMPWWHNLHDQGWGRIRPLIGWTERVKQWDVAGWIDVQRPDFLLHLGDIVYWRPGRWDAHDEAFFRPFAGVLHDAALFTIVGNHDIPEDRSDAPPFETIFHNPWREGVGRPQRNYTFAWGSMRVVAFDVIDPEWSSDPNKAWLESTLRAATEPWLIVAVHILSFSVYREDPEPLGTVLWEMFEEYGVDLVVSGDDHHFARFKKPTPDSPIQVIVGGGGKSLYEFDESDERLAASRQAWSFLVVEANGALLEGRVMGSETEVIDTFSIDKSQGPLAANHSEARRERLERLRR